jgi:hypothetical protein
MSEVHLRRIAAALEAIAEQDGQRFAQRFADDVEKPAEVDEGELLRFLLMHSPEDTANCSSSDSLSRPTGVSAT